MTATRHHPKGSWRMTAAMRRTVSTLRYVNDELVRANEAIFRPAGAPQPSTQAGTPARRATDVADGAEAAPTGHTGRAA